MKATHWKTQIHKARESDIEGTEGPPSLQEKESELKGGKVGGEAARNTHPDSHIRKRWRVNLDSLMWANCANIQAPRTALDHTKGKKTQQEQKKKKVHWRKQERT